MSSRGKIWTTRKIDDEKTKIDGGLVADYSPFFDGDTAYRAADIVFDYSQEEIEEIARCASDVVYFGEKYCFSMTDEGIRKIKLRDYQKDMLKGFQDNRFTVMLASRQIGKTICSSIMMLHYVLFNNNKNVLVTANKLDTAVEVLDKIREIYQRLPFFLQQGIINWNQKFMVFENKSRK